MTSASNQAQSISTELLQASQKQSREIQETGQAVLQMAGQITDVSSSANESAEVARQSVAAAEQGSQAVENAIKGMNEIREQIQETSKRIKRLGESSQEIGEITELISDITEQTNVLALNAAIQAASAGEAGRGFSVVAEEVQRLAERSAEATKQIGALVRTIQTDTHDAVAAMEKSTQGVVEGARLSDAAGAALADIRRVSNQLAELIQGISTATGSAGAIGQRRGRQYPEHPDRDRADPAGHAADRAIDSCAVHAGGRTEEFGVALPGCLSAAMQPVSRIAPHRSRRLSPRPVRLGAPGLHIT